MESRIVLKAFTIGPVPRLRVGIELSIELGVGVGYKRGNLKVGEVCRFAFVGWIVKGFNHGGTGITEGVKGFTAKIAGRIKSRGEVQKSR